MKRKKIAWTWENPDAQQVFAEWRGFPDKQKTSEELDKIEALAHVQPPMRVLDVGCGTGRHALEMARRGYLVVGIDVARSYLVQARRDAERLCVNVEFRLQRGSELREEAVYDFVLAYFHTLGFMSDHELTQHFVRIRAALKPSRKFLLRFAGPRLIPGQSPEKTRDWAEKDGKFILSEKYIDQGYRNELGVEIDIEAGVIKEFRERQKAFGLDDVISILEAADFGQIDCLKDLDGTPGTPEEFGVFVCHS